MKHRITPIVCEVASSTANRHNIRAQKKGIGNLSLEDIEREKDKIEYSRKRISDYREDIKRCRERIKRLR